MKTKMLVVCVFVVAAGTALADIAIGERPTVENHLEQDAIESGQINLEELNRHGKLLFDARFNILDGQGRPATTGSGQWRSSDQPVFIRTSGPEANSCSGCHNQPESGGAGDIVANVFVLAQTLHPVTYSVSGEFSNERNTPGMHGAGQIEMLAREMSDELIAIRQEAATEAAAENTPITRDLVAKNVNFGTITVMPDGKVDPDNIEGVDWDLIIKPFHQKGAVVSIREFTNNAMNHHHGIQASERFGEDYDADEDGYVNEMTVGDITAITVFQATLTAPGRSEPDNETRQQAAELGENLFDEINCTNCHVHTMTLKSQMFSEPNPYNPQGNLRPEDVNEPLEYKLNFSATGYKYHKSKPEPVLVHAFTDLKRRNLNDETYYHFDNEQLEQGMLTGFASPDDFTTAPQPRPTGEFLTRKLWDVGSSAPYGHRGDLTTMTEAIYYHGGQAKGPRDMFFELAQEEKDAIIEFLKTLQVITRK